MTASAALTVTQSTETFGLTPQTPQLIAKLRKLDPALLAAIRATGKDKT